MWKNGKCMVNVCVCVKWLRDTLQLTARGGHLASVSSRASIRSSMSMCSTVHYHTFAAARFLNWAQANTSPLSASAHADNFFLQLTNDCVQYELTFDTRQCETLRHTVHSSHCARHAFHFSHLWCNGYANLTSTNGIGPSRYETYLKQTDSIR